MEKVETVANMRALATRLRARTGGLSLVPSMGALHAGHEALIRAAASAGGPVVVSIFANPLSFGSNENFSEYPRTLDADLALCERLGVGAAFTPSVEEVYPRGFSTYVTEERVRKRLCGISLRAKSKSVWMNGRTKRVKGAGPLRTRRRVRTAIRWSASSIGRAFRHGTTLPCRCPCAKLSQASVSS